MRPTSRATTIPFSDLAPARIAPGSPLYFPHATAPADQPTTVAIGRGDLLIVDELDASLHPALTAALVTMFKSPDINTTGAQILFSTHDATPLGNSPSKLLDPEEVWFCEKRGSSLQTSRTPVTGRR